MKKNMFILFFDRDAWMAASDHSSISLSNAGGDRWALALEGDLSSVINYLLILVPCLDFKGHKSTVKYVWVHGK